MLDIAVVLGGPTEERGISLNSSRSIADHIASIGVNLAKIVYYDKAGSPFLIERGLLYCNTTSDFDYRLASGDLTAGRPLTHEELLETFRSVDIVFPAIHGKFGEDGGLQSILEEAGVPFVGAGSEACIAAFDKYGVKEHLEAAGVSVVPSVLVTAEASADERRAAVDGAFPESGVLVVKPTKSGSSIGVEICKTREIAVAKLDLLLDGDAAAGEPAYDRVIIQPWIDAIECTTTVLQGAGGPVGLIPTEVELLEKKDDFEIFDGKRKYLNTDRVRLHCPPSSPSFTDEAIERIRSTAEAAFTALGMRDFARIDGWLKADGTYLVSEVNPISGMDPSSFLFVQAGQVGMNHADLLRFLLGSAARRAGLEPPQRPERDASIERTPLRVLFGGNTAESDVSVMSGLNVWLKLQQSTRYAPEPYLLDEDTVWKLSYSTALHHSANAIRVACRDADHGSERRAVLAAAIAERLGLTEREAGTPWRLPTKLTLDEFLEHRDPVFIALHGGIGENGTLQRRFDDHGIAYNGSGPEASALCNDKNETGKRVAAMQDPHIGTAERTLVAVPAAAGTDYDAAAWATEGLAVSEPIWRSVMELVDTDTVIVKPNDDGCSAGIVRLAEPADLAYYLGALGAGARDISGEHLARVDDHVLVEMPTSLPQNLLFEEYIETDVIRPVDPDGSGAQADLSWSDNPGWVEVTVGVIGHAGEMHAMNPSLTVSADDVLSLEEKFMSGTGINLTPPPTREDGGRVAPGAVENTKALIEKVANELGIAGYARIDAFMNRESGDIVVIEANTLPGMTAATVFFQQGVAEVPALVPVDLLERIVDLAIERAATPAG